MGESKQQWLNKYILASNNRFWKEEGKNKGIGSKGGWIWPKKKVPLGNVWKKSKGTSFGLLVAAWLPLSLTHTHTQHNSRSQWAAAAD